jgi:hypothetical protein
MDMRVDVHWRKLGGQAEDPGCLQRCVLYAYYSPAAELMYVGKADKCSVAERSTRSAKSDFWDRYEEKTGHKEHIAVLGELELGEGKRFSSPLLSDVESLLINQIQPAFNTQCLVGRILRPGLVVCCQGYWPLPRNWFHDNL